MNLDKLNQWLMLIANLGVLAGILAVVFELEQTQIAMRAEASSTRAQMSLDIGDKRVAYEWGDLAAKLADGNELSRSEIYRIQRIEQDMLRYFENLHYQYELGVLDQEIWAANYYSISRMCNSPPFRYVFPNWPNEPAAGRYRASFVQLVSEGCN